MAWCGVPEGQRGRGGGMDERIFVSNDCVFIEHFQPGDQIFFENYYYICGKNLSENHFFLFLGELGFF